MDTDEPFCVQRHIAILKSCGSTPVRYLGNFLVTGLAKDYATSVATGIAQKTVPISGLRMMPVPLPPLPEQHRIVAKVDQLLALCDTLERQIEAATAKQSEILKAVLVAV